MRWRLPARGTFIARGALLLALLLAGVARAAAAPQPPQALDPELIEIALGETLLAPADYSIAIAATSLAAGTGVGGEIAFRYLGWSGFALSVQVSTLRRTSRDAGLGATRLSAAGLGIDRRFRVAEPLELRLGLRAGADLLVFDDASSVVTGLGLAGVATLQLHVWRPVWLEFQGGVFGQPLGGSPATGVTIPPTGFAIAGFCVRM